MSPSTPKSIRSRHPADSSIVFESLPSGKELQPSRKTTLCLPMVAFSVLALMVLAEVGKHSGWIGDVRLQRVAGWLSASTYTPPLQAGAGQGAISTKAHKRSVQAATDESKGGMPAGEQGGKGVGELGVGARDGGHGERKGTGSRAEGRRGQMSAKGRDEVTETEEQGRDGNLSVAKTRDGDGGRGSKGGGVAAGLAAIAAGAAGERAGELVPAAGGKGEEEGFLLEWEDEHCEDEKESRKLGFPQDKLLFVTSLTDLDHFLHAVALARSLRRTLVLPGVCDGRMGIYCGRAFCQLFDPKSLSSVVDWVERGLFEWELKEHREENATGFVVVFKEAAAFTDRSCGQQVMAHHWDGMKQLATIDRNETQCFDEPVADIKDHPEEHKEFKRSIFSRLARFSHHNVLFFLAEDLSYWARHLRPFFPKETTRSVLNALDYAPHLHRAADQFVKKLGPNFIAAHWTCEFTNTTRSTYNKVTVTHPCIDGLVQSIYRHQKGSKGRGRLPVFLATDAPHQDGSRRTFNFPMTEQTNKTQGYALKVMEEVYERVEGLVTGDDLDENYKSADVWVKLAFDQLMCIKARTFLSAAPLCSVGSMFEEKVKSDRAKAGKESEEWRGTGMEHNAYSPDDYSCPATRHASRRHGRDQRKYLIIIELVELLTKNKLHLAEAAALASALNRTLVLPGVSFGMFADFRVRPLCTYLDFWPLGECADYVTQDQFLWEMVVRFGDPLAELPEWQLWDQHRGVGTNATGFLALFKFAHEQCGVWEDKKYIWKRMRDWARVADTDMVCFNEEELCGGLQGCDSSNRGKEAALEEKIINTLQQQGDKTILFVQKTAYELFIRRESAACPISRLPLAPQLQRQASLLQVLLGQQYMVVQWRLEKCMERDQCAASRVVKRCKRSLIRKAKKLVAETGVSSVFFATDAPYFPSLRPRSESFVKNIEKSRVRMAATVANDVREALDARTWDTLDQTVLILEPTVQGIMDQLLSVNAERFLTAPYGCSGWSSYVEAIINTRKDKGKVPYDTWKAPPGQPQGVTMRGFGF